MTILKRTLKTFRKIQSLKIIVAVRSDVLEKAVSENKSVGFQRDKFSDILEDLSWDSADLKQLVNKRINYLFRSKYTKQDVHFDNIFPDRVGKVATFDYMVERTLYRPRDILDFVNICLKNAREKAVVSVSDIRAAEVEYSKVRLQAVGDEWRSLYPAVDHLLEALKRSRKGATLREMADRETFQLFIERAFDQSSERRDPISRSIASYIGQKGETVDGVAAAAGACLYRMGVIGLKLNNLERFQWSHFDAPVVSEAELETTTRLRFHPMFMAALGINQD